MDTYGLSIILEMLIILLALGLLGAAVAIVGVDARTTVSRDPSEGGAERTRS